jgi:hypothetical protein
MGGEVLRGTVDTVAIVEAVRCPAQAARTTMVVHVIDHKFCVKLDQLFSLSLYRRVYRAVCCTAWRALKPTCAAAAADAAAAAAAAAGQHTGTT